MRLAIRPLRGLAATVLVVLAGCATKEEFAKDFYNYKPTPTPRVIDAKVFIDIVRVGPQKDVVHEYLDATKKPIREIVEKELSSLFTRPRLRADGTEQMILRVHTIGLDTDFTYRASLEVVDPVTQASLARLSATQKHPGWGQSWHYVLGLLLNKLKVDIPVAFERPFVAEKLRQPRSVRTASAAAPKEPKRRVEVAATRSSFPTTPAPFDFARGEPRPDDIAVIIGNADYGERGKDIPDVVPAYADAEAFKQYAIKALGVRQDNIIHVRDASGSEMLRLFGTRANHKGQLFDWTRKGRSRVYVYYAGHGAPTGADGSAYLVPADADGARIELNGYPLDLLYANLGKLLAQSVTVVLEACFSGTSPGGGVVSKASPVYLKPKLPYVPDNLTVISAGAADQMASWEQDSSHGLFTKYFLTGMSGEADKSPYGNGDGAVTHAELRAYLKDTLTYYARRYYGRDQTAQIVTGKGG